MVGGAGRGECPRVEPDPEDDGNDEEKCPRPPDPGTAETAATSAMYPAMQVETLHGFACRSHEVSHLSRSCSRKRPQFVMAIAP